MYFNQILWHTLAPQAAYIISVVAGFIKWVMDIPGYSAVGLTTHKPYLSPIYVGNLQRRLKPDADRNVVVETGSTCCQQISRS